MGMEQNPKFMKKPAVRPTFPKRAIVTGGMPYGNKSLHFGHVGGVFVFADAYARFLRDRIGKENVIFVSGTDCYGSPIAESYRKFCEEGKFEGTLPDFVQMNHLSQKKTLEDYDISLDLFAASGLGDSAQIHNEMTDEFIRHLYENGWLARLSTKQFFDEKAGVFLNGRQVVGKCPVEGCASEKGYADECDLGHQYMPENLINPKSTLTGETPIMKDVANWYFRLTDFGDLLTKYTEYLKDQPNVRAIIPNTISEFLKAPEVYIKNEFLDAFKALADKIPAHKLVVEERKPSFTVIFEKLDDMNEACKEFSAAGIRYRTGKTLVPFRLTGNIEWGVQSPRLEGEEQQTVWVWPESLWAPISFTKTYLARKGADKDAWKDYWCSKDAKVFQFIGQDNIYFYGIAQTGMFMAQQGADQAAMEIEAPEGKLQQSVLVANHHVLFLNKKASSSGSVKPPMAAELLDYYTAEQLRMHYLGMGLGQKSVSFQPKPLNPVAKPEEPDPVLKEGLLLSNVYNRIVRTCFYTVQKYFDGMMPVGEVSQEILDLSSKAIEDFERFMYRFEFHQCSATMDNYIRKLSKFMARELGAADKADDNAARRQALISIFHGVRVAAVLLHSMAPRGTEMVCDYLNFGEEFWSWDNIDKTFAELCGGQDHAIKFLEPKVDFFTRHPSQFAEKA